MALMTVDVNDMVGVNAAAFRVLSDNLGDDATRAFISQFKNSSIRDTGERSRVTASQLADILENARAEAEAGRGKGSGDATKEKYERPQMTFEEVSRRIMAADVTEKARLGVS
ncbi:MAG: hypothetical protein LBU70_04740 [Chitinispirillales bacterium]|jgi:hypothetical protein|nr:hypothetical protein [Chitinispirillales bacterium]